jgi:hypothetical protein
VTKPSPISFPTRRCFWRTSQEMENNGRKHVGNSRLPRKRRTS